MDTPTQPYWQRLLHRWFVEYNPLYPLSAALVLLGAHVLSRDLLGRGYLLGQLGVPAIAELYAWALIGGAALLTRIGLRRPAVMLSLLAALYQCDLTLHTETCMYLGGVGWWASAVWLASFVAKIRALGWAMELRLARSALVVPSFAAFGLVVMPRVLRALDTDDASLLLGAWIFAVFAAGLWTSRMVQSTGRLDGWGITVLGRSLRATWTMWAVLCVSHALFWCSNYGLRSSVLVPVALLLATRFVRREASVWAVVVVTLVLVGGWMPALLSLSALLSAVVLGLCALRRPSRDEESLAPSANGPYRQPERAAPRTARPRVTVSFGRAGRASMVRLLAGSIFTIYLSMWTLGWSGGAWPAHVLLLDALLTLAFVLVAWQLRLRAPLASLVALYFHYAVSVRIIVAPSTMLEWGLLSVGAGFAMLIASLAVSYQLRPRTS